MQGPQQSILRRPARSRKVWSRLVRKSVQARDDPAKQRIRRWLSDINDERVFKTVALLCGACLFVALLMATYGLDLSPGLF
jgi:hypothetical protein